MGHKLSEFPEVTSSQVQTLLECMAVCESCADKCLEEGHIESSKSCTECAEICHLAINAACTHSKFEKKIMNLCSDVCKKCADVCSEMEADHCQECSAICNNCCNVIKK